MKDLYIGGEFLSASGDEKYRLTNPANGEVLGSLTPANGDDVDRAVAAAVEAQRSWAALSHAARAKVMAAATNNVRAHVDELAKSLTAEVGKTLRESRLEINRFAETMEHYVGLGKSVRGTHIPGLDDERFGFVLRRPIGVVGAILPWNFPTTLLANKLAPALLMGNALVAKPAQTTPFTTLRVAQLLHEGGLPAGLFNVVTGRGSVAGQALVEHPDVPKLSFTGSTPVGKQVSADSSEYLKRVTLELGGSDPMIIFADSDIDEAISAASVGRFFNCGQACLATKRLFVAEEILDEVVEKLVKKVERLVVGPGDRKGTIIGPMHSAEQLELLESQVEDAVARGGRAVAGGHRLDEGEFANGHFYAPTLLIDVPNDARVATEETFGPALPIWGFSSFDEVIERANSVPFGLGSTVWTRDLHRAMAAAEQLDAGYTWINSVNRMYDELPFGGLKQSGMGKEHGTEALDFYSESKSVVVRHSPKN